MSAMGAINFGLAKLPIIVMLTNPFYFIDDPYSLHTLFLTYFS